EAAVGAGAEKVDSDEESHENTCAPDDFSQGRGALAKKFGEPDKAGFFWEPKKKKPIDEEKAAKVVKIIDVLEDNDDVQTVYTNFEVSEEILKKLAAG